MMMRGMVTRKGQGQEVSLVECPTGWKAGARTETSTLAGSGIQAGIGGILKGKS
jgi:hypothetical protein